MIKIDWTILLQAGNFLLLMFVLNLLLYRPLRDMLQRRRAAVEGGHGRARELEGQINEKMTRYQEQLRQAKLQGNAEKAALRAAAAKEEAEIMGAAHQEASEHLKTIKSRVGAEAEAARQSLRGETEALAAQVAAKVLGRSL